MTAYDSEPKTDVYVGLAIVCIVVGVLLIWWLAR